jgi:hypothetical protein
MQKTQAEPPGFAGIGQTGQQIGDLLILGAQLGPIAIAGLADPKGPAGQRNACPTSRHCILGHLAALTHGKCAHLSARQRMADLLFSQRFLQQIVLHAQVRKHSLQPAVLFLNGLHLADHGRIHAAILCSPFVERRIAHAMFTAKLGHRHTTFSLSQDRKDLGFAISGHLHLNLLVYLAEKILLPQPLNFGGDYHSMILSRLRMSRFSRLRGLIRRFNCQLAVDPPDGDCGAIT